MSVGLRTGGIWTEIGNSELLHAFFSTISYHLESSNWGSKYPYLLNKLYYDKLDSGEVSNALAELIDIRQNLTVHKPTEIIWDYQDLTKKPSDAFYSKLNASNLSESFKTLNGKNIFDVLSEVLEFCKRRGIGVKIQSENDLIK